MGARQGGPGDRDRPGGGLGRLRGGSPAGRTLRGPASDYAPQNRLLRGSNSEPE